MRLLLSAFGLLTAACCLLPAGGEPAPPAFDTSKLVPLTELRGTYHGFGGGLYPNGNNTLPGPHHSGGMAQARAIRPLGLAGTPDPRGKIVLLSVGMSNTTLEFEAFQQLLAQEKDVNPAVVAVDGAQGAMPASVIAEDQSGAGADYWNTIDGRLADAGLSRAQVQAVWLKEANARPTEPFPEHARLLQNDLAHIVRILRIRFPRCRIVYLSSRIYGGYATTPLNPEPYAYESGFAVKWLIEDQIHGHGNLNYLDAENPVEAPWLAWGPYLWANGTKPDRGPQPRHRSEGLGAPRGALDGLTWQREDFEADGTHPSQQGREKVARLLMQFLKTEPTAKRWFMKGER